MRSDFRYFIVCESASALRETGQATLRGVMNEIVCPLGETQRLTAVASYFARPSCFGKSLELRLCFERPDQTRIYGTTTVRLKIESEPGSELTPSYSTTPLDIAFSHYGVWGFEILDVDGCFSSPGSILSTFKWVVAGTPTRPVITLIPQT